ncbi:putative zinc finger protein 184-like [Triplophysa rosa]|uniref:Zinc finger protein 184-like n=1 Tax=Triplophysa rosa TaxID=992332 RepID=A0A9W7X5D5_TRIRA|nr:putative zinc finger protein 184-like [Triplophysa rosa]
MNPCVKGIDEDSRILAVSKCLEDALEAALRNALELALKIAMTEFSRLTDQALRDVRDQIHESQQENITLKLRLQHIHAEHDNPKLTNQSRIKSTGSVPETQESDGVNGANMNKEDTSDPEKKFKTIHTQHTDNIQHVDPSDQDPSSSELVFEQVKVENEKPEPEDQGPSIEISWSSSGCVSSFSTPFDGLNQSVDKTSLTQSTQNCREIEDYFNTMSPRPHGIKENQIILAVSTCLEDALEAALRGAFEVAVEIAVKEVSRLTGQALRDIQDQIHESQQDNFSLKLRLQQIHTDQTNAKQLSAANPRRSRIRYDNLGENTPRNVCERVSEKADEYVNETFYEIGDDGRSRSHEMRTAAINENNTSDHIQQVEPSDQDLSSFQPKFEQVKVKNEKAEPDLDGSSGCDFDDRPDCSFDRRSNEEFELDRIALAQSKLSEDWRPDSELQKNETESLDPGPSLGTSEILVPSSGCVSSLSTPFDGLYQSAVKTSLTQPPENCRHQVRTNVQSKLYVCKFCGHSFHSESDQRNHHIQYHKPVKRVGKGDNATRPKERKQQLFPPGCSPFHCDVCNRDFNRLENLKTHLRIHTGERPYSCSVCGIRFRHGGALTRHFRIHTGEKPYVCSECGKSFRNCGGLRFHQKSHSQVHSLSS